MLFICMCFSQDIDWLRYLKLMFDNVSLPIDKKEEVVLYAPDYMRDLIKLIQNTDKR